MLIVITGTKGSKGVTTLSYALTRHWSSRAVPAILAEADPDGGAVAARLGLSQEPGLATLAAGTHQGVELSALGPHLQRSPGSPPMLLLPSAPGHARAVLRAVAERLADIGIGATGCKRPEAPGPEVPFIIADVGRLGGESPSLPLVVAATRVVVVTAPTLEGADAAAVRLAELADIRGRTALVTVGDGPYRGEELSRALSVGHLGHLPEVGGGALSVWSASRRRPRRWSAYLRAVSSIAERLRATESLGDPRLETVASPPTWSRRRPGMELAGR